MIDGFMKKLIGPLLVMVLASGLIWFGASVVAGPRMMHIIVDSPRPTPTPKPVPTSFNHAGRMACERYQVDYKLWLSLRQNEMGRRNLEMGVGVTATNAAIAAEHPYFPQAYWAAYLLSKRQREFSMVKGLQLKFSSYGYPFIAYVCSKWRPRDWRQYYWSKEGGGVGASYHKNTVRSLEKKIKRRAVEMYGGDW